MQWDWNSFCGNVVFDSFNMAYRDEDILDQKYDKQKFWIFIMKILNLRMIEKMHIKEITHITRNSQNCVLLLLLF